VCHPSSCRSRIFAFVFSLSFRACPLWRARTRPASDEPACRLPAVVGRQGICCSPPSIQAFCFRLHPYAVIPNPVAGFLANGGEESAFARAAEMIRRRTAANFLSKPLQEGLVLRTRMRSKNSKGTHKQEPCSIFIAPPLCLDQFAVLTSRALNALADYFLDLLEQFEERIM
jgi:hypothetical protein